MRLHERLVGQIRASGPLTIADYVLACLHDPHDGYYATRPALGAGGDFITAPLVSQIFGELIGLWILETIGILKLDGPVSLVEIGPGDGTLMADILRTLAIAPAVRSSLTVTLVETSSVLTRVQQDRLADAGLSITWISDLRDLPDELPTLIVANELLDCLPARQFQKTTRGWAERRVGLDADGRLTLGLAVAPGLTLDAPIGAVFEQSPAQAALGASLGSRIATQGGAALLIDYGRDQPGFGDTLQALKGHEKVDPLADPGTADLTQHADFPAVLAAASAEGAMTGPIRTQRDFLISLGIAARYAALCQSRPDQAQILTRQVERLIDPDQMGTLFKAACIYQSGPAPPGF